MSWGAWPERALTVAALAVVVGAALPPGAQGVGAATSPEALTVRVIRWNSNHQAGRLWGRLHPTYRAETTREAWEACKRKGWEDDPLIEIVSVRVIDSYEDEPTLPKLGPTPATAVTATIRFKLPEYDDKVRAVTDTVYWVEHRSRWYGVWTAKDLRAYRRGSCP